MALAFSLLLGPKACEERQDAIAETALMLLKMGFSLLKIVICWLTLWGQVGPHHICPGSYEMQLTCIQPRAEELLPVLGPELGAEHLLY